MKLIAAFCIALFALAPLSAQDKNKKKQQKKERPAFSWVSPRDAESLKKWGMPQGLRHATFKSESMGIDVGYYIYLPPQYEKQADRKFNVVYHLHGGRPGAESKSINLCRNIDAAIRAGDLEPTIYVWPNGGPLSWYNHDAAKNGQGEDIFVKELVPHIDRTYRVALRGIEGFSQGGRGTTRIMFKHPGLWASAAPGGSGYEPEQRIQQNEGWESDSLRILPGGYNTWDLAKAYSEKSRDRQLPILLWVGTKGFNYEFNLKYSDYLKELGIPHEKLIVPDVAHSARDIYEKKGLELMKFHEANFKAAKAD